MAFMSVLLMLIASPIIMIFSFIEMLFTDPQMIVEMFKEISSGYLTDIMEIITSFF